MKRFFVKIKKTKTCWLWIASKNKNGYGEFRMNTKVKKAHRIAWELANGEIPEGLLVCHRCDVRHCVNPSHLFLGDHKDNARDMVQKGRNPNYSGNNNPNTFLRTQDIKKIRRYYKQGVSQTILAKIFFVSQPQISRIVLSKQWI